MKGPTIQANTLLEIFVTRTFPSFLANSSIVSESGISIQIWQYWYNNKTLLVARSINPIAAERSPSRLSMWRLCWCANHPVTSLLDYCLWDGCRFIPVRHGSMIAVVSYCNNSALARSASTRRSNSAKQPPQPAIVFCWWWFHLLATRCQLSTDDASVTSSEPRQTFCVCKQFNVAMVTAAIRRYGWCVLDCSNLSICWLW